MSSHNILRRMQTRRIEIATVIGGVAGACTNSTTLPGTSEGTFSVVGTLGTNTCGSSLGASNPWDFSVELSEDGSVLYMEQTGGGTEYSGTLAATTATMSSSVTTSPDSSDAGAGTCYLTQDTTFTIDLNSSSSPSSFTGSVTYNFSVNTSVSSSTNCADQLSSQGGSYATLPCKATYALTATKQ